CGDAFIAIALLTTFISLFMIVHGIIKRNGSGLSTYIFVSSLCLNFLIFKHLFRSFEYRAGVIYQFIYVSLVALTNIFDEFRFLLLCILAIICVSDIRVAVTSVFFECARNLLGMNGNKPMNAVSKPSTYS
ncbi:hypothetical protein PMAYCL1PPCAC_22805, partial [Pristionchus mayeri]